MSTLRIAALLVVVALSSSSVVQSPLRDTFELLILHNNDMHARFEQTSQLSGTCTTVDREAGKCYGGFPRVAYVVKEARKAAASGEGPPVLYLNAGDTYTGTAWFTIYKWKIAAEFLNALQPDAVSLGNHELDNGVSGLTPFIENLTCPVLAANLILTKVPELEAEPNLMKSVIFNVNGTMVGVIGYLTPDTKVLAIRSDVDYTEEVAAIKEEVKKLKSVGIKIFIALGHSGFTKDLEIAKKVEDIDLVIGGHTNTFLWNGTSPDVEKPEGPYPMIVKQASGKLVPAVQAYAYTKYLGKLHLVFNAEGELVSYDGNPILLDNSIPQDPDVLKIVDRYSGDIKKVTDLVVGKTAVALDGHSCRLRECNMGNLITDSMVFRYARDYNGTGWTDAPISVIQGGGIRASIVHADLPANVTKGDLLTVMPFDGSMVVVTLNGSVIWQMMEHAVAKYNTRRPLGQFLQYSGLEVEYDFSKPPWKRVVSASVRCGLCGIPIYSPLNKSESYKVLMTSFLSRGGDGFFMLNNHPSTPLDYDELISTVDYVQTHGLIFAGVQSRIKFNNYDKFLYSSTASAKLSLTSLLMISYMSLGNHEFDNNVEGLTPFIENLTSPVLAANLILDKVPDLAKQSNLKKSITFNISGTNVGVIGYLTPETKFLAKNNDVEYVDEITALKVEVAKLQNQGIKIIVALGHSGFLKDLQIAKEVKGLDLVIGGHSNTFLWNGHSPDSEVSQGPYPTYVKQDSGRSVLVVQAYAYTKYLGKLHIIFDADGEIVRADGQPILLDKSIPQDPEIVEIVERYKDKLSGLTDGYVGETANILDGLSCQYKECNLGNLITDAIFYTYTEKYKGPTWTDINVAIMQGGGIRASIDHAEREISKGDLLTVLPFGGNIAKLQLNGSTLLKMLEHSVANYDLIDTPGEFLQFSGMRVVYDLGKNIGNRVVKAKVRCSDCKAPEYFKLDSDKMYTILVPEFLAKGGDGYKMLIGIPYEKQGYDELHCTETYIRRHSPVFPEVEDRIILKTNQMPSKSSILSSPSLTLVIAAFFVFLL